MLRLLLHEHQRRIGRRSDRTFGRKSDRIRSEVLHEVQEIHPPQRQRIINVRIPWLPVAGHPANGAIEVCVRELKSQIRAVRLQLE